MKALGAWLLIVGAVLVATACASDRPSGGPSSVGQGAAEAARGRRLAEQLGCLNCHSTDGRLGVGPSWKGLAGSRVRLAGGQTVRADSEYLTRAIIDPDTDIVAGYSQGVMAGAIPRGQLTQGQVADLVAYLQSL